MAFVLMKRATTNVIKVCPPRPIQVNIGAKFSRKLISFTGNSKLSVSGDEQLLFFKDKLQTAVLSYYSLFGKALFPVLEQVRSATKKAGGSVKRQNHNRKRKGKRHGPKVLIDQLVQPGQILMRQKGFRIHPGRNVDYGKDCTLFALREGFVKITQDVVKRPEHLSYATGPFVERTFMHVQERPKVRRLVCLNPESLENIKMKPQVPIDLTYKQ